MTQSLAVEGRQKEEKVENYNFTVKGISVSWALLGRD